MATIFEKLPASGEKCSILDVKEALIYPFDFGDWSEIRASVALSFTSPSSDNSPITAETGSSSTSPKTSMFIGLYSGAGDLPFNSGTSFVGFGNRTGTDVRIVNRAFNAGYNICAAITMNTDYRVGEGTDAQHLMSGFSSVGPIFNFTGYGTVAVGNPNTETRYFVVSSGNGSATPGFLVTTGDSRYAIVETMSFKVINKGQPGQSFQLGWSNYGVTPKTDVSISALQTYNSQISTSFTGLYYNSNCTSTGSQVDLPNKFLLYFPFTTNRVRVHSLLLEKY